jgi:hypothetical protein
MNKHRKKNYPYLFRQAIAAMDCSSYYVIGFSIRTICDIGA